MTAQHAAARRPWHAAISDGLRSLRLAAAALATRLRALLAGIELRLHWWDWAPVRSHWYRQYKRADRKAFAAECEAIRLRAATDPAPGAAPGQAPAPWDEEAALRRAMHSALFWADPETPAPAPAQDEAATAVPATDAATLPLPPADPPSAAGGQGQPYADWPQPPLGALVIPLGDGAVEYRRPDAIITVRPAPGGGTSTEVWTPRRRDLTAELEAAGQPVLVRPAYRRWLDAHPEAEVAA